MRPDLWKKGVEHYKAMKVAAGVRRVQKGNNKNAANGSRSALDSAELNANGPVQGVQWVQVGPQPSVPLANINFQGTGPMSGEVLDIAIDPRGTSDQVIYIATNDGGVWKSSDGGVTFKAKTDFMPSMSMGAVALDPTAPWTVYAGTGNLFDGNGTTTTLAVKAVGIYKSVDMGESWAVLNPGGIFTGNGINRILVLPGNVVLVASANGLFRSVNGGLAFGNNSPLFDNGQPLINGFITDLDLHVSNGNTIYASVSGVGIRVSTDGGITFPTNLFTGGYDGGTAFTDTAFIAFAQSESDPQVMYMNIQRASDGNFHGLYRSANGGGTWARRAGADARAAENNGCQCGYDQTVGVDPLNADRVFIGFQELYVSADGGANFGTPAVSRNKIHWDHHALIWSPVSHRGPNPANVRMWVGTDGGLSSSDDYGGNFNNNYNATIGTNLFTDIDIGQGSAANNAFTVGGTQDTGTLHKGPAVPNVPSSTRWSMGINGDGGGVAIDPSNPNRMYGGGNNGYIVSNDGGQTWAAGAPNPFTTPPWRYAINRNNNQQMYAITSTDSGGFRPGSTVLRTLDGAASWQTIATLSANARAIANTPADPDLLWLGLQGGVAARITNATAANPADVVVTNFSIPGSVGDVSGIAINPLNSNDVVVTFRGVCGSCAGNPSLRQKRVYRTLNGGTNWTDISGTDGQPAVSLPNIPHHSVVFDIGTSPAAVIVSHDAGVNVTYNNGSTWERMGVGLPTADSKRLRIDDTVSPPLLRLGTYGRSVWQLSEANGPIIAVNADLAFDSLCLGTRATRIIQVFNVGSEDLMITSIFRASGSTDFSVLSGPNTPVTIKPGEELDWTIEFKPTSAGAQTAIFQINSTDPNNPSLQINASGIGNTQAIAAFIADSGNFGEVCTGSFKDLMLSIANVGCGQLTISNITSSDSSFVLPNAPPYPLTILAGTAMQIPVRFQPATPGAKNGNITISSNDPSTPSRNIAVSGTVGEPNIILEGLPLNFGEVCLGGASLSKVLTIRNSGSCTLNVSSVAFVPACTEFTVADTFPRDVLPGSFTTATIQFTPTSEGSKSCNLRVQSNDPDTPTINTPVTAMLPNTIISATPDTDLVFLPEVVQSTGACFQQKPFSFTNQGKCPVRVESASATGADYSFVGLPALPLNLQKGQSLGENNLKLKFGPLAMDRDVLGTVTVNYVKDAATGEIAALSRTACGEGVRTGARVLVQAGGVPVSVVEKLQLLRITANRNGKGTNVDSVETLQNVTLKSVDPDDPCGLFQYHREYGTTSNPVQLLTGSYQVTATILQGNKRSTKTVSFSVDTCDFNPQVIINF